MEEEGEETLPFLVITSNLRKWIVGHWKWIVGLVFLMDCWTLENQPGKYNPSLDTAQGPAGGLWDFEDTPLKTCNNKNKRFNDIKYDVLVCQFTRST